MLLPSLHLNFSIQSLVQKGGFSSIIIFANQLPKISYVVLDALLTSKKQTNPRHQ